METEKKKKVDPGMAMAKDGIKRCSTCGEYKPIEEFGKNKRANDGLQNCCKPCKHNYWNALHQKKYEDPAYRRRLNDNQMSVALRRALRTYGLTQEEYEALIAKGCGICGGPPTGRGRYAFDHDHETNEFRGLLCSFCNTAIGLFKDNLITMSKAQQYLICTSNKY